MDLCESCGREIQPGSPETVHAVEVVRIVAMGRTADYVDGRNVVFHEDCYPTGSSRYFRASERSRRVRLLSRR